MVLHPSFDLLGRLYEKLIMFICSVDISGEVKNYKSVISHGIEDVF